MSALSEMKAKQLARKQGNNPFNDPAQFQHWNLPYGGSAILRFVPYNDPVSEGFWAEKKMVPMTFIHPDDDTKQVFFNAPSKRMYGKTEKCKVTQVVNDLFEQSKALIKAGQTREGERIGKIASKHWLNQNFLYQGFVIKQGFDNPEGTITPENPIRIFDLKEMIHQKIWNSIFMNDSQPFDDLPTGTFTMDEVAELFNEATDPARAEKIMLKTLGNNFIITKTKKIGEGNKVWANYDQSEWVRSKQDALTDEQLEALHKYGLHDLSKKLPEKPTDAIYDVMYEMIQVSIAGGTWNRDWEEVGLKFYAKKDPDGNPVEGPADEPATSTVSVPATSANSVLGRLKSKRAAATPAEGVAPTPVAEAPTPAAEPEMPAETQAEAPAGEVRTRITSLSDRIKSRVKDKAA